jgi:hypothetical protein
MSVSVVLLFLICYVINFPGDINVTKRNIGVAMCRAHYEHNLYTPHYVKPKYVISKLRKWYQLI